MEKVEVQSSNIKMLRFNQNEETLDVWFNNSFEKEFYRYKNIDLIAYTELLTAESKGKHFAKHFRSLPFEKIPVE